MGPFDLQVGQIGLFTDPEGNTDGLTAGVEGQAP